MIHLWGSFREWLFDGGRWMYGIIVCAWGLFTPVHTIFYCAIFAVGLDFITGNIASYKLCSRNKKPYRIISDKMWKSVWKLALVICGVALSWAMDTYVLPFSISLPHLFASFVLGAEFCSFLENASIIAGWTVFNDSKKLISDQFKKKADIDLNNSDNNKHKKEN